VGLISVQFILVCQTLFGNNFLFFAISSRNLLDNMRQCFLCTQIQIYSWIRQKMRKFPIDPHCENRSLWQRHTCLWKVGEFNNLSSGPFPIWVFLWKNPEMSTQYIIILPKNEHFTTHFNPQMSNLWTHLAQNLNILGVLPIRIVMRKKHWKQYGESLCCFTVSGLEFSTSKLAICLWIFNLASRYLNH